MDNMRKAPMLDTTQRKDLRQEAERNKEIFELQSDGKSHIICVQADVILTLLTESEPPLDGETPQLEEDNE